MASDGNRPGADADGWMSYATMAFYIYCETDDDEPTRYQRENVARACKRLPEVETENRRDPENPLRRVGYARLNRDYEPRTLPEWYRTVGVESWLIILSFCPACGYYGDNKLIVGRAKTVRMECGKCAMRWTMDIDAWLDRVEPNMRRG
jgi:hypothetical protein